MAAGVLVQLDQAVQSPVFSSRSLHSPNMGGLTALLRQVPTADDAKSALTLRNLNFGP